MTFDEMAKDLGVSKSTISRALSGKGRIGEKTRNKVRAYALEHDLYTDKEQPGTLEKTRNIGVVIPADVYTSGIPYFHDCLLGIGEAAAMMDYNVLITTSTMNDIAGVQKLVEQEKVDGIVLTRSLEEDKTLEYLTQINFPVGLTGTCDYEQVIQVDTNNESAAESLTSLLIGNGYRRFALLVENLSYHVNMCRYKGVLKALNRHGLSEKQQFIYTEPLKNEFIDSIIEDIFTRKIECIICGDDVVCTRIVSRLQAEGYRIPKDIAVVSLYNSPNLNCFSPAITAVNTSAKQIGNIVGKQLINYLEGREYEKKTVTDFEILFRKSANKTHKEPL